MIKIVELTIHSKERMKERLGINKTAQQRLADIAYIKGLKHGDLSGSLKRYADKIYLSNRVANQIRIYGDYVYLFRGDRLITVQELPNKYKKTINKLSKEKNT